MFAELLFSFGSIPREQKLLLLKHFIHISPVGFHKKLPGKCKLVTKYLNVEEKGCEGVRDSDNEDISIPIQPISLPPEK